jgi:hypothetical protein
MHHVDHTPYRLSRKAFPEQNPDWRDPYRHITSMNDSQIAFEFLRRNETYWDFVAQFYSLPANRSFWPMPLSYDVHEMYFARDDDLLTIASG